MRQKLPTQQNPATLVVGVSNRTNETVRRNIRRNSGASFFCSQIVLESKDVLKNEKDIWYSFTLVSKQWQINILDRLGMTTPRPEGQGFFAPIARS